MREKLKDLHTDFAYSVADLSHCKRQQNACVLTSLDGERVLSFGYNGTWRGGPNECTGPIEPGKCECVHAEINALVKSRPFEEFVAFVTTSPCKQCAKALINAGAKRVYCAQTYRDAEGVVLLGKSNVEVHFLEFP